MLLSSVIIVLREVLEAALLISLLLAFSTRIGVRGAWLMVSLAAGAAGAVLYGFNIDIVSDWFDGVGQEVVNAVLQVAIYVNLCLIAVLGARVLQGEGSGGALLMVAMVFTVATAIVREGSEILVYFSGFFALPEQLLSVTVGGVIGAGIGASAGGVFYYALLSMRGKLAWSAGLSLLALVSGGMAMQATQLLIQADWLPAGYPVWNSSWLVEESSVTGQLLYALLGYEAAPTGLQVAIYLGAVSLIVALALASALLTRSPAQARHWAV